MKLEDQVCSLELSNKLKNLGVKQESLFWYTWYCSAFAIAELGEMIKSINFQIELDNQKNWMIHFWVNNDDDAILVNDENLANAIAKMLIYLLENKLMELPNE